MRFISHRGNLNGAVPTEENKPEYIDVAIQAGFDCEVDVWHDGNRLLLGHDAPQYPVEPSWLVERQAFLWCHAKNILAATVLRGLGLHWFWHETDTFTLTSQGQLWCYKDVLIDGAIVNQPTDNPWSTYHENNYYGLCSDYIDQDKELFMLNINLKDRRTLVESLNTPAFTKAVEVGVRTGWYSKYILDHTNMTVDSVDCWDSAADGGLDSESTYSFCSNLLAPYGSRNRMIREYSPKAAERYLDNSLDFVYIDASHNHEAVKADLEAWYPKVKEGKIIAGHDFSPSFSGVVQAVTNFCQSNNLKHQTTGIVGNEARANNEGIEPEEWDVQLPSWVIVKPKHSGVK